VKQIVLHFFHLISEIVREISARQRTTFTTTKDASHRHCGRNTHVCVDLFPPVCLGCGRLLRHDLPLALCSVCRPEQAQLPDPLAEADGVRASWTYDGPLSQAIVALKFSGVLALAGPLGRLLSQDPRLRLSPSGQPWELAVAVPLHWRRRMLRGFDQSEELLRWALHHARGEAPQPRFGRRLLARRRPTAAQTELCAEDRQSNVKGAFVARRPERLRGRRVLIVDDVATTGATLSACIDVVAACGAPEVGGLALLRSVD